MGLGNGQTNQHMYLGHQDYLLLYAALWQNKKNRKTSSTVQAVNSLQYCRGTERSFDDALCVIEGPYGPSRSNSRLTENFISNKGSQTKVHNYGGRNYRKVFVPYERLCESYRWINESHDEVS